MKDKDKIKFYDKLKELFKLDKDAELWDVFFKNKPSIIQAVSPLSDGRIRLAQKRNLYGILILTIALVFMTFLNTYLVYQSSTDRVLNVFEENSKLKIQVKNQNQEIQNLIRDKDLCMKENIIFKNETNISIIKR